MLTLKLKRFPDLPVARFVLGVGRGPYIEWKRHLLQPLGVPVDRTLLHNAVKTHAGRSWVSLAVDKATGLAVMANATLKAVLCRRVVGEPLWRDSVLLPPGQQNLPCNEAEVVVASRLVASLGGGVEADVRAQLEACLARTRRAVENGGGQQYDAALSLKLHVPVCYAMSYGDYVTNNQPMLASEAVYTTVYKRLSTLAHLEVHDDCKLEHPAQPVAEGQQTGTVM